MSVENSNNGNNNQPILFVFGLGYTGIRMALEAHHRLKWKVYGTVRSQERIDSLVAKYPFLKDSIFTFDTSETKSSPESLDAIRKAIENENENENKKSVYIITTIPSNMQVSAEGYTDPVISTFHETLFGRKECQETVKWLGYLSTTGVYGNYHGEWIDETAELKPSNEVRVYMCVCMYV